MVIELPIKILIELSFCTHLLPENVIELSLSDCFLKCIDFPTRIWLYRIPRCYIWVKSCLPVTVNEDHFYLGITALPSQGKRAQSIKVCSRHANSIAFPSFWHLLLCCFSMVSIALYNALRFGERRKQYQLVSMRDLIFEIGFFWTIEADQSDNG